MFAVSYKYQQCPFCFELSIAEYPACPFCANSLAAVNYHPWRRFFARMVDCSVILTTWFLAVFILFVFLNQSPEELTQLQQAAKYFDHPLLSYPILGAVYILSEAFILSRFGNTPGKKLYQIRLFYKQNKKPTFRVALKRTFMMWSVGMGLTVPLVNLYAFYMAHKRLVKTGVTLWDAEGGFQVSHGTWGGWYMVWVVLVSVVAYLLLVVIYSGGSH